ncbi:MAG: GNAT family N-acetyltransferase [Anaerolineales bacterium]
MNYEIVLEPKELVCMAIDQGLLEFNLEHLGEDMIANDHRVLVKAEDGEGNLIGGVHGEMFWDWLHVKTLWVSKDYRGQGIGSELLRRIEQAALDHGFKACHLETISFQALDFYRKLGYEVFGELRGKPAGSTWYFMKKDLSMR